MRQRSPHKYFQDRDIQAISINYHHSNVSLIIVFPRALDGLSAFHRSLSADYFSTILKNLSAADVSLHLPRFKIDASFELIPELTRLGINRLFDRYSGDLSGMSDKPLYVGSMIHKALVELNEEGTEAAAASAMTIGLFGVETKPPGLRQVSMIVDHPFFFAIHSHRTDTTLFMGSVVDPDPNAP